MKFTAPFSERWVLAAIGACAAALLLLSILIGLHQERENRLQASNAAMVQARILAETSTAALSFGDRRATAEYVDALSANPDIDAAGVYDELGIRIASFGVAPAALPRSIPNSPPRLIAGQIVDVAPVTQSGERLGFVYLRIRAEPLTRRLSRYAGAALLVVMASLMFVALGFYVRALGIANADLRALIAERDRSEAALRQAQKMEAISRLTGGIAHDFNNMLAIILGSLDVLRRRMSGEDPKLLRLVESAAEGAKRAADVTQRLLAFSSQQPLNPQPTNVSQVVQDISVLLVRTLGESVTVETRGAAGLWPAFVDAPQLEAAVLNLSLNARDAMPDGGKLTIECGNAYLDRDYVEARDDVTAGQYVLVAVSDTGTGIAPDVLSQVFEPFFTTKPIGMGTGLGLSQVHGFIRQSGGHVAIASEVGVGTTVRLYIPRSHIKPEVKAGAARRATRRRRRNLTVLIVEDEAGVRDFAIEAAAELGFDPLAASDGAEALELLRGHPEIALALTDVIMPGMSGREFAARARASRPDVPVVFMTGYTREAIVDEDSFDPETHLVTKPFTVEQLSRELDAALGERGVP